MTQYATIAELQNFIVLNSYTKAAMLNETPAGYQTEAQLESELITDLQNQGYEYLPNLNSPQALLDNARAQLQTLNNIVFTDAEWKRFNEEFLNKENDSITDQTRKIQGCCVYDFTFDDGHLQNITLVDKQNHARNKLQVINQFEQTGTQANRYDVTILVNGLPMVQVELKKRGVNIREAFNQVHRYSKESFRKPRRRTVYDIEQQRNLHFRCNRTYKPRKEGETRCRTEAGSTEQWNSVEDIPRRKDLCQIGKQ